MCPIGTKCFKSGHTGGIISNIDVMKNRYTQLRRTQTDNVDPCYQSGYIADNIAAAVCAVVAMLII